MANENQIIDYKQLAAELSAVIHSKDDLIEKEKHAMEHKLIAELIPFSPLIIELCKDLQERRERRKRMIEKVTGAIVVSMLLAALGFVGRYTIEEYNSLKPAKSTESSQVIKAEQGTQK